ncbi:MAG: DUF4288 domain-containing protein [Anaerolineales bacterium]|nr:DUF4288 domain-containing protein [Anaerolineales bacterium]
MKKYKVHLYGLDSYGITIAQLIKLGDCPITVKFHFKYIIKEEKLFSLPPSRRNEKIKEWYINLSAKFKKKLIAKQINCEIHHTPKNPTVFGTSNLKAHQILFFLNDANLQFVSIVKIKGLKRKRIPVPITNKWFAVQARFAIQIEGQTKGMQTYEERIVLIKSQTEDKAKKQLLKEFNNYGKPYLNSDGYMVRWQFERFLDIYWVFDDEINKQGKQGAEIFSVLKNRKMKPEYQWKT